jgi:hypothetical protein
VVVPEQDPLPDAIVEALGRYVEGGGRLMLSGAHLAQRPALARLAGVEPAGEARQGFCYLPVEGAAVTVAGPWQPVRLAGAAEWAALLRGREPGRDDAGSSAITLRQADEGRVAAAHGPIFAAYYRTRYPRLRALLRGLFRQTWGSPLQVEAPGQIAQTVRRLPGRTVVHLVNRGADPAPSPRNVMVEQVPHVGPVAVRLRIPQRPASVTLVPDDGAEVRWTWRDGTLDAHISRLGIHAALVIADAHG